MVKRRPGSRKGQMKLTTSGKRAARKVAGQHTSHAKNKRLVIHEAMREVWDDDATAADNLGRIGLLSNVNVVEKQADSTIRNVRMTDVRMSERRNKDGDAAARLARRRMEEHAAMPERGTKQLVRPGERIALKRLSDKYGTDWEGMSRDIKLNYLQWTQGQLKKRIERMHAIEAATLST